MLNRWTGKTGTASSLRAALLLTTALSAAAATPAVAVDWVNPGTGNWFDPANWTAASVPGAADPMAITNGGTAQVLDGDDAESVWGVIGSSDSGTVDVVGLGSTWTTSLGLYVGDYGQGTLNISSGGAVTTNGIAYIGANSGSTGFATVTGAGSTWMINQSLFVGYDGIGTLTISDGALVDAGNVAVNSLSTINIGAAAGDAAVAAGTLDALTLGVYGKLVFNHTDTRYTLDTYIYGGGTIRQMGPGTTVLAGASSYYWGNLSVEDGTLIVNGLLGGYATVTGGTLGGRGTLFAVALGSGATIAPGDNSIAPGDNSIDTLSVTGNLSFDEDSTYEVEISGADSDRIDVGGTATLGGTVQVLSGTSPVLGVHTILTAGSISGSFDAVTGGDYLFLTPELSYDLTHVYLQLQRNGIAFADVASTSNQAGVAAAADALGTGDVFGAIAGLNAEEAQVAFDALSGEGHATIKGVLIENSALVRDALLGRMRIAFAAPDTSGVASGYAGDALLSGARADTGGIWGQFYGGLGSRVADGHAAAADYVGGGLVIGTDAEVGDWRLGFAADAGTTQVSIADRATTGDSTDLGVGVYGGTEWGDTDFAFGASVTHHSISTTREVGLPGLTDTLTADYGATTGQLFAELDHEFDLGEVSFMPFGQVAYVGHMTDAFTEQGGAAALSSAASRIDSTFATLGLRSEYQFVVGEDGLATIGGGLGWRHAFADMAAAENAVAGGSAFTVSGTPIAADAALLEGGFDLNLANGIDFSLSYVGQVATTAQSHVLRAGVGGQF